MDAKAASPAALEVESANTEEKVAFSCSRCFGAFCGVCWGITILLVFYPWLFCSMGWTMGWFSFLAAERPPLIGSHRVGTIRGRLPAAGGRTDCGLFAQLHYPAAEGAEEFENQWIPLWRPEAVPLVFGGAAAGNPTGFLLGVLECVGNSLLGHQPPLDPQAMPLASQDGGWPVVIFSHGLYGVAEMYQQLCRDIASMGAIVVAVEHEDGSATYAQDCAGGNILYSMPGPGDDVVSFRRPQLNTRLVEYGATVDAIKAIINAATPGASPVEAVIQTGNAEKLLLVGHSFGACGAFYYMQSLAKANTTTPLLGSMLLDAWAEPLVEDDYSVPVQEPFIHITSDNWGEIPGIKKWTENNPENTMAEAQVRGTNHEWVTEAPFFMRQSIARCCSPIELLGTGDFTVAYRSTMLAVENTFEAILNPALRPALSDTILAIDDVIAPFD